jgi:sodium-coupled monocarboxylate transporter 8/12
MSTLLTALGIALFSYYENASAEGDPLAGNLIDKPDEILPYFLIHEVPHGIAGLVIAALFGTTMSVFSAGLNSAATSTVVDLLRGAWGMELPPEKVVGMSRKITGLYGVLAISTAFLAELLGQSLVKMTNAAMGLFGGPTLGVFLLGIFNTRANAEGCWCGLAVGVGTLFVCVATSIACSKHDKESGGICTAANLSEFWYGTTGALLTVVVGSACSYNWPAVPRGALAGLTVATRLDPTDTLLKDGGDGKDYAEIEPMIPPPSDAPTRSRQVRRAQ